MYRQSLVKMRLSNFNLYFFILSSSLFYGHPCLLSPWIGGLTPMRATASYSNDGLVAATISPYAADCGRVSAIGVRKYGE